MSLIEITLVMLISLLMITSVLPQFIASMHRQIAETIYSHLITLDKALWNIDFILKANDPNLDIPRPSYYSITSFKNLICGAEPYRWKNLSDYSSVRDQLYDNFLDPRGRYVAIFSKYSASLNYSTVNSNTVKYTSICLTLPDSALANRIKALDGSNRISVSGNRLCYYLNNGAGFTMVARYYNCQL